MFISMTCAGRLAGVPEITGNRATFSVAVDAPGGKKDAPPIWVRCVAFDGLAEKVVYPYLKEKGQKVLIVGTPKASAWVSKKTGEAQSSLEMVVRELKILTFPEKEAREYFSEAPF